MLERIARAIDPERWAAIDAMPATDSARNTLIVTEILRAYAVVRVMREPTEARLLSSPGRDATELDVWQTKIDAILAELP